MIGSLRGRVLERVNFPEKSTGEVLLEVAGVGYTINVSADTLSKIELSPDNTNRSIGVDQGGLEVPVRGIGAVEESRRTETFLFIYHHITEADQKLFGFISAEEKLAFKGLLAAHGVGPSLALAVLATHSVARLARILDTEDLDALCEVPGVGKKTAQRLLVELRSSLVLPILDAGEGEEDKVIDLAALESNIYTDVREALTNLGYSQQEVRRAMDSLVGAESEDSGELLKLALRSLAGG